MIARRITAGVLVLTAAFLVMAQTQTVHIAADDLMRFKPTQIKAPAGTTLKVVLTNAGRIPVLQHNFVLLVANADANRFGNAAMNARATGFIPESMKDQVVAHTGLVASGESAEVSFTVPAKGTYTFICSFPGHFSESRGTLVSE